MINSLLEKKETEEILGVGIESCGYGVCVQIKMSMRYLRNNYALLVNLNIFNTKENNHSSKYNCFHVQAFSTVGFCYGQPKQLMKEKNRLLLCVGNYTHARQVHV